MASKGRPGAVPSAFEVEHDGERVAFDKFVNHSKAKVEGFTVPRGDFPACPICLLVFDEDDRGSEEHVPRGRWAVG